MPLDAASLAGRIKTNLSAFAWFLDNAAADDFCQAIADAVVAEIQTNAQILPGTFTATDPTSGPLPVAGEGEIV